MYFLNFYQPSRIETHSTIRGFFSFFLCPPAVDPDPFPSRFKLEQVSPPISFLHRRFFLPFEINFPPDGPSPLSFSRRPRTSPGIAPIQSFFFPPGRTSFLVRALLTPLNSNLPFHLFSTLKPCPPFILSFESFPPSLPPCLGGFSREMLTSGALTYSSAPLSVMLQYCQKSPFTCLLLLSLLLPIEEASTPPAFLIPILILRCFFARSRFCRFFLLSLALFPPISMAYWRLSFFCDTLASSPRNFGFWAQEFELPSILAGPRRRSAVLLLFFLKLCDASVFFLVPHDDFGPSGLSSPKRPSRSPMRTSCVKDLD